MTPNPNPSPELLPCPFCGSAVTFEHDYREDDNRHPRDFWHVRISCCYADTGWTSYGNQEQRVFNCHVREKAEASMAETWNTRALSQTLPAPSDMPTIWEDPAGKGYPCFERPMTPAEARETIDRLSARVVELEQTLPAPGEVDYAEAARVMFEACRQPINRAEQCYPMVDALAQAGFFATVAAANDEGAAKAIEAAAKVADAERDAARVAHHDTPVSDTVERAYRRGRGEAATAIGYLIRSASRLRSLATSGSQHEWASS